MNDETQIQDQTSIPNKSEAPHFKSAKTAPTVERLPESIQADGSPSIDSELIDKTKQQIRTLVSEISELAQSSISLEEFFEGFLIRTTTALASEGGAIWIDESNEGQLKLVYHINLQQTKLATDPESQQAHTHLLNKTLLGGEPVLVPPHTGSADDDLGGNPTDKLLIFCPLHLNNRTVGLVEIIQRPGAGPTTQRGYLRFLTQMSQIASDFLKTRKIRNFDEQQLLWQKIDGFVNEIHHGLDLEETAFAIANEGKRIIECDRVSVIMVNSGSCCVRAVSGLDSIERRAEQIKYLQRLTQAVVRSGQPLYYSGDDSMLPPQIEKRLHEFLDLSHTKMIAVLPIAAPEVVEKSKNQSPRTIAALVVEDLKDSKLESATKRRIELIARHSKLALGNAIEHDSLFLMPLWKTLGKWLRPFNAQRLPKTLLLLTIITGLLAFLAFFPYPFHLSANGRLMPCTQHEVYAQVGGILQEILVESDGEATVFRDDVLARMTNNDLMVQIQNLNGQINQTTQQIKKYQRAYVQQLDSKLDQQMLDGELNRSREELESLKRELDLKRRQAENLVIRSPADGIIVNWQLKKNLFQRPVDRGQNLMTVVDPSGGWQLELEVPERRVGHLMNRLSESSEPIEVNFALLSYPGFEFVGKLEKIDRKLEVYSEDGNCAKAIVRFDNAQLPTELLKSGTRINAQLHCGERSIGYVWFHELFETVETSVKYWL